MTTETPTLILASASPRRQAFLRLLGIPFRVRPAHVDERPYPGERPDLLALRLSWAKAYAVAREEEGVILAADTLVVLDGQVLGKPKDPQEARAMLRALRGRWHTVYTGLTLLDARHTPRASSLVDAARVRMRDYSDAAIDAFVESGKALDKAGAYAIQDEDFAPVARIEGCMATVMGLPVARLLPLLADVGIPLPEDPTRACRHFFGHCCLLGEG
ncbi:MAG: septum formation protein Maf [Chloroflexi bacterium]|nr:septum formation protein Maf [Chloroflexota bacterium]